MDNIKVSDITRVESPGPEPEQDRYEADQVGPGKQVTLHFELTLANGELVDSNFDHAPATFAVGDGNLLPGFEHALFGMRAGEEKRMTLAGERAFGVRREENIQSFPRYRFPADLAMERGLMLNFSDSAGNDQPGVIAAFDSARVEVDFNHPLAGLEIHFRARIVTVEVAENE